MEGREDNRGKKGKGQTKNTNRGFMGMDHGGD